MGEMKNTHIVEIPLDREEDRKQTKSSSALTTLSAIQHHPLTEISHSPGHLLLLKLWQRDEDLFAQRIALRETQMDSIKRELFQICASFALFHGFFLTILFISSIDADVETRNKWWVPGVLTVLTSVVLMFLVQVKLCRYWKVWGQIQGYKNENRALTRCVQELKTKGASFDLSKEPQSGKRMKSSSVEIKWKPLTWCSHNLITIALTCFTASVFPATKFILCGL